MTRRRPRAFWERLVADYEGSGALQKGFAADHGVKLGSLQHWLYRLRRERVQQPTRLVPVRLAAARRESVHADVEMAAAGVLLRFEAGADAGYLARLVAELERRRC